MYVNPCSMELNLQQPRHGNNPFPLMDKWINGIKYAMKY